MHTTEAGYVDLAIGLVACTVDAADQTLELSEAEAPKREDLGMWCMNYTPVAAHCHLGMNWAKDRLVILLSMRLVDSHIRGQEEDQPRLQQALSFSSLLSGSSAAMLCFDQTKYDMREEPLDCRESE